MKNSKQKSQIIIYKTENGQTKIDVRFDGETVWLNQKLLAELFQVSLPTINEHIKNIYQEAELEKKTTIRKFRIVQNEGGRKVAREIDFYNLDLIISVGYRVKSSIATSFRQWATKRLGEYIVKGFVLDDERLKNPDLPFDYFEDLTRRINDRNILLDAGKISHELALEHAGNEYEKYRVKQDKDYISDFDREVKK